MPRKLAWIAVILLAGILPCEAARLSAYEVGAFAGAFFGDDDAGVENDLIFGLRANVTVGRVSQIELVADRVETEFDSFSFGDLDETFTSYAVHWVFNYPFPRGSVVPYFFLGIGTIEDEKQRRLDPGDPLSPLITVDDDDEFVPVGGGFRKFVSNRVGVRFEGRLRNFRTFGVSQDAWDLTVGLTFHLGPPR